MALEGVSLDAQGPSLCLGVFYRYVSTLNNSALFSVTPEGYKRANLIKYKIPIWLLRQYNPDLNLNKVRAGIVITFPKVVNRITEEEKAAARG